MGKLYLVATPIGNLEDMTLRGLRVLGEVDYVLAEDTRRSGILLKHYGIIKPVRAFHAHNEHGVLDRTLAGIAGSGGVAYVSDAGTPGISDPGYLLVRGCIERGIGVECLPGAVALIPALMVSGLPTDRFVYEGFLPVKKGRQSRLTELQAEERTMVLYESPHRLRKTLEQLAERLGGERKASVSRELTKRFEETRRGTLSELAAHYAEQSPRGEFVIVVSGKG